MGHVSLTDLRRHMARYFDQMTEDREPLVVKRQAGKENVVVMSEAEFRGWQETVHLLSSPKNAERLMESVRQIAAGLTQERALIVPGTVPASA